MQRKQVEQTPTTPTVEQRMHSLGYELEPYRTPDGYVRARWVRKRLL